MKRILLFAALVTLFFPACKSSDGSDPMILPQLAFKTGVGYTSRDTTVGKNVFLLTGIRAAKSEPADVLKRFSLGRGYDADTLGLTTVFTDTLTGLQGDEYSREYTISTRNVAGKETYIYTVVNRDGLINQVKLHITVQ